MTNDKKFIQIYSNLLYKHSLKNKNERIIVMIHGIVLSCDYQATSFTDSDKEYKNELPEGWNQEQEKDIYSFKYKKDKKTLTLKIVVTGSKLSVNLVSSEKKDDLITDEIDLSKFSGKSLSEDYQECLSQLKSKILKEIETAEESKQKRGAFDLKPTLIDSHYGDRRNPNQQHQNDIWNPAQFEHPTMGQGEHMGPEHPFFNRRNNRVVREDPAFPFGGPGSLPGGPGGFGGGGSNFPFSG